MARLVELTSHAATTRRFVEALPIGLRSAAVEDVRAALAKPARKNRGVVMDESSSQVATVSRLKGVAARDA